MVIWLESVYPDLTPQILRKVTLPIISDSECEDQLNSHEELGFEKAHNITWDIHKSFICAGGEAEKVRVIFRSKQRPRLQPAEPVRPANDEKGCLHCQQDTCEGDGGGPLVCTAASLEGKPVRPTEGENEDIFGGEDDLFGSDGIDHLSHPSKEIKTNIPNPFV